MSIFTNKFWLGDLNSFETILKMEEAVQARVAKSLETGEKFDLYAGYESEDDEEREYQVSNGIAIIPVVGDLVTKETWITRMFGMPSYDGIKRMLNDAAADESVTRIVMDFNTPGGSSEGIDEVGLLIGDIDDNIKPVHGYTSGSANSAGYWLISSCRDVTCTKMARLGSIGVVTIHQEISKMLKERGIEVTVFRDGEHKAKPNMYEKLDEDTRNRVEASLKILGNFFLDHVAAQRGFSRETVRADVGEGRVFFGEEAVEIGLADRIMFFDDFLKKLSLLDSIDVDQNNMSRMVSFTSGDAPSVQLNVSGAITSHMMDSVVIPAIEASLNGTDVIASGHDLPTEDIDMSAANAKDKPSNTAGKKIQTANGELTLEQAQASVELGTLELTDELKLAMAAVQEPESAVDEDAADIGTDTELNTEEDSADLSSETPADTKGGDPVVLHIQGQLNDQISANATQAIELETVKAKLSSQDDTVKALSAIAMNSCQKMNIAMGGAQIDLSSMDTATLLAHHNTLSEQFTKAFNVGGVAAVETTKEHAEDRPEQMVAPLNTVSFTTK